MRGSYLLILSLKKPVKVKVGSLGSLSFPAGYYVYAGSALGPGGLKARVNRHRRLAYTKEGKLRWHIDYLLTHPAFKLAEVWLIESEKNIECLLASKLKPYASQVFLGFGSSDCRGGCGGHLLRFQSNPKAYILKTLGGLTFSREVFGDA